MKLAELLREAEVEVSGSVPDVEVRSVTEDSRKVTPGALFVARVGTKADGGKFLSDAAAKGAVAAISVGEVTPSPLPTAKTADPAATSKLAQALAGKPSRKMKVLGVTGTNGKTTTTYLLRHVLAKVGTKCGMIGTVEIDDGKSVVESEMTTPGAVELAELMRRMATNGCGAVAMEVSSHALDQGRAAAIEFAGAGFTNLTGDHLDYHKTMDAYADAKAKLFSGLASGGVALVNGDSEAADRMVRGTKGRVLKFGIRGGGDYRASDVQVTADGTHFTWTTPEGAFPVDMMLVGRHNIENAMVAMGLAREVFGLKASAVAEAMRDAKGAPGRLESVRCGQSFAVLVDYAHTDDALENVLTALRPLATGKLRVLFGCGGDRDRTKRPRMAKVAEKYADEVWITSDNPRTEDPAAILSEIVSGLSKPAAGVEVDRRKAIEMVIGRAQPGDIVLIAGKGHENYQIMGTSKHHFDDREEAARALRVRPV